MRAKRANHLLLGIFAALLALPIGYYYLILDWQGRPFCHKQIMLAFKSWMGDHDKDTNRQPSDFPNINGKGADSLATIREEMGGYMDWAKVYKYVPGLREDDPGDLVLMYVDRPTRWTWHGQPPTIFKEKAWILVPVDFVGGRHPSGPGELSERVSQDEFRSRLTHTLDFIRTNRRPNWQTIVAEHTKFLDSLDHAK